MNDFQYIRDYYKVPAEYGREILYQGDRKGVIVEDMGNYIGVLFDDNKPTNVSCLHPTDKVEYLGIRKKIRQMTASQKRYRQYMEADSSMTFGEWLKAGCYNHGNPHWDEIPITGFMYHL